jgi:phosphoribosylaminoimidazole (AIR) synthetase
MGIGVVRLPPFEFPPSVMPILVADEKELASRTLADVIRRTKDNFPDERFRPENILEKDINEIYAFKILQHWLSANSDGTGTKPELAERLATMEGNYAYYESIAFDLLAMVIDDVAREGGFAVGVVNCLDVNSADDVEFIAALACGLERACNAGMVPLISGETAELGHRTPGWGKNHLNWNAVAIKIVNELKQINGSKLAAGQPVVALREQSIRSNGLTDARNIVELAYLNREFGVRDRRAAIVEYVRRKLLGSVSAQVIDQVIDVLPGENDIWSHIQLPWHEMYPDLTKKLLTPSTIYAPAIYAAQGGVDGEVRIPIVGCAHISGGGVPTKAKRMLEGKGLGLSLASVFPAPSGVNELIELAQTHGYSKGGQLFDKRRAAATWNMGVGKLCAFETPSHADEFVTLANGMGYEAAVAGEITNQKKIEWCGETWEY